MVSKIKEKVCVVVMDLRGYGKFVLEDELDLLFEVWFFELISLFLRSEIDVFRCGYVDNE